MALVAATMFSAAPTVASAAPYKLFIDPGHGGRDPGAVKAGFTEKASNLRISRLVAKAARRQGWSVKMSRYSDRFVNLNARARMANSWRANGFVSIHANSTGSKSLGYMTIYRGGQSRRMGRNIMVQTGRLSKYADIGNKRDVRGLAVLRGTRMPAVLVETMAVTSPRERAQLKDPRKQAEIAEAIVRGIARYRGVKYVPPKTVKPKANPKPKPTPVDNAKPEPVTDTTTTAPANGQAPTRKPNVPAPQGLPAQAGPEADANRPQPQLKPEPQRDNAVEKADTPRGTVKAAEPSVADAPKNVEVLMRLLGIDTIVEILTS